MRRTVTVSRADKYFSVGVTGKQPRREERDQPESYGINENAKRNLANSKRHRLHPRALTRPSALQRVQIWVFASIVIACIYI